MKDENAIYAQLNKKKYFSTSKSGYLNKTLYLRKKSTCKQNRFLFPKLDFFQN